MENNAILNLFLSLLLMALMGLACAVPSDRSNRRQSGVNPSSNATSQSPETNGWQYDENADKMGRGTIKQATVLSSNTVSFDFPYQGEQHGQLTLRTHPEYGQDVILSVEKGQFLTGIQGCRVQVRFDNNKPVKYWARGAADHSTTSIFLDGYSKFISNLKQAKKVSIEAPFFQEGDQVFEFDVVGLKWDESKTKNSK